MRLQRLLLLSCVLGACRTASVTREYEAAYPVFENECPVIWLDDHGRALCPDRAAEFVFPDIRRIGAGDRLGCPADKVGTLSASWTEKTGGPILEQIFLSVSGPADSELARHAKEMGGDALRVPDRRSSPYGQDAEENTLTATVVRFRNPDCRCVMAWAAHRWPRLAIPDEVELIGADSEFVGSRIVIGRVLIDGTKPGGRAAIEEFARFLASEMGGNGILLDAVGAADTVDAVDATGLAADSLGLRGDVIRIADSD